MVKLLWNCRGSLSYHGDLTGSEASSWCLLPHLLAQLLVLGLQVLAVSAPRGVELDQHVFAVVVDDGVKVLGHHDLNATDSLLLLSRFQLMNVINASYTCQVRW